MQNIPPLGTPFDPNVPPSESENKPNYVLDTFAVMAYLQEEKGQERERELLVSAQKGNAVVRLSLINWGELVYTIEREQGTKVANQLVQDIDRGPFVLEQVSRGRIAAAARIKSSHSVSYADAFAIALAKELDATLVTGDPEFKALEKEIDILWLSS